MGNVRSFAERTRKPTGRTSHPIVLIEGPELVGKTFESLLLTASDKVGPSWHIQLGEVDGDAYGAIIDSQGRPVRHTLVETDGTWPDIMAAVEQTRDAAVEAVEAGEKPPVVIFDSLSQEWELLTTWADNRARSSEKAKKALAADPNAEIDIAHLYWNASNRRHRRLMALLRTFPGIVILTARGKPVSKIGRNGQPVAGEKEYTLEAQKQLGFKCTAWVRLSHDDPPMIVGARLPRGGVIPGRDRPLTIGRGDDRVKGVEFSMEWLVFDFLGYDPATASTLPDNDPRADAEPDLADVAEEQGVSERYLEYRRQIAETTAEGMPDLWAAIAQSVRTQEIPVGEGNQLREAFKERANTLNTARPAPPADPTTDDTKEAA